MVIKYPSDLNEVIGGKRIYTYEELKDEVIPCFQMLKNATGLEYVEFYRGHGLERYKLECGLSRYTKDPAFMRQMDKELQERFLNEIYVNNVTAIEDSINLNLQPSFEKQWKLNFQAQHLGLKTRLLDWSINWRIGLLFAVDNETHFANDGIMWIFFCPRTWRYNNDRRGEYYTLDLNEISEPYLVNMVFYHDVNRKEQTGKMRAWRQSGRFIAMPYEQAVIPMEENHQFSPFLIKLIIDAKSKKKIKEDLYEKERISSDWAYVRKQENVDEAINTINNEIIKKYG